MARDPSVFVHPAALCESDAVGPRTRVWAFAHVLPGAVVGSDCNLCDHVYVETGATVGDNVTVKNGVMIYDLVTIGNDVFLGPGVVFTNDLVPRAAFKNPPEEFLPTSVEQGATIGANATIVCGSTIGTCAFVAAGAVVVDDVPPHAIVVGNPARPIGWMCACGNRLSEDLRCECGRAYSIAGPGLARQHGSNPTAPGRGQRPARLG
jgi:acetyltransferase-like isoleucine patch superfamily enzyme